MATKANVPIVVAYLDYKKKEIGIKGVIYDTTNYAMVIEQINKLYNGVSGRHPQQFALNESVSIKELNKT